VKQTRVVATAAHLLALGSSIGCGRPPDATLLTTSQSSSAHPSATPTASAAASAPPAAATLVPMLPDGCYADVDPKLPALPKLQAVAASCVAGMVPLLGPPAWFAPEAAGRQEVAFTIEDASKCIRAIATADPPTTDLELRVVDASDAVVGKDELPGSLAMVAAAGPVCVAASGTLRAVIHRAPEPGPIALQVWVSR